MDNQPTITLQCVTKNGKRERTTLTHHSLAEAREVAKWVIQAGNGLYTEVEIYTESGYVETIHDKKARSPVGARP